MSGRASDENIRRAVEAIAGPHPGLWVPVPSERRERWPQGLFNMIRLYVTHEELAGVPASTDELIPLVSRVERSKALPILSAISVLTDTDPILTVESQVRLADTLIPEAWLQRLRNPTGNQEDLVGRTLFHEQQILTAVKYLLLYGQDSGIALDPHDVGRILLLAGELVDKEYSALHLGADHEKVDDTTLLSKIVQAILIRLQEPLRNLFARYYRMLVEIPREPAGKACTHYIDVGVLFTETTGVDIEIFMRLGFVLMMRAFVAATDPGRTIRPDDAIVDEQWLTEILALPASDIHKLFDTLSLPVEQFATELASHIGDPNRLYYDFVVMRERPLVRLSERLLVPVTHRLLKERVTSGTYWILHRALRDRDEKLWFRFLSFFGELFELYVRETFERMFSLKSGRLYFERDTQPVGSDIMVLYPDDLLLFEVCSSRFVLATRISGELPYLEKDFQKMVVEKAGQLDRVIRETQSGKIVIPGFNTDRSGHIWPIIIGIEPWPEFPLIRDMVEALLKANNYLQMGNIGKLLFLSAEEVEMLEPLVLAGHNLRDIVRAKQMDDDYKHGSMKNFLYARYGTAQETSPELRAIFERGVEPAKAYIVTEG